MTGAARGRAYRVFCVVAIACAVLALRGEPGRAAPPNLTLALTNGVLTMGSTDATVLRAVQGRTPVYVVCVSPAVAPRGPWPWVNSQVGNRVQWAANASSAQTTLPAGLPDSVANCIVETPSVPFVASGDVVVSAPPPAQARRSAPAGGPTRTVFVLNGRRLTIRTRNPNLLGLVRGDRIIGECRAGENTWQPIAEFTGPGYIAAVSNTALWARHADAVTVTFPLDLSSRADDCSLAVTNPGLIPIFASDESQIVFSGFTGPGRRLADYGLRFETRSAVNAQLTRAYRQAKLVQAKSARWLSAAALVRVLNARAHAHALGPVLAAPDLHHVNVLDAVFVVSSGTASGAIELAARTGNLALVVRAGRLAAAPNEGVHP